MNRYDNGAAAARWRRTFPHKHTGSWRGPLPQRVDLPPDAPEPATDTGPTVGRWERDPDPDSRMWKRAKPGWMTGGWTLDAAAIVNKSGPEWAWSIYEVDQEGRTRHGTAPTLSAAMLAADDALRAAGERLPEVVTIKDWPDGRTVLTYQRRGGYYAWDAKGYPSDGVYLCAERVGTATTLAEALDILDAAKPPVDTAIARAQLREREVPVYLCEPDVGAVPVWEVVHGDDTAPTVGRWGLRASRGAWSRCVAGSSDRDASTVWLFNARWVWDTYSATGRRTGTGTAPTLSAAMLAADDALRAAGERLPETVAWHERGEFGPALYYVDGEAWRDEAWGEGSETAVFRPDTHHEPYGRADTLLEALDILDAHDVDTAIARAQLREREVPVYLREPDVGAVPVWEVVQGDDTATRKSAAEGWGWIVWTSRDGRHFADSEEDGVSADTLPALLDAIEAREVEAAEGRGWTFGEHEDDDLVAMKPGLATCYYPTRSDLLTAIHEAERADADRGEVREIVARLCGDEGAETADLPLAGVVLSGRWEPVGGEESEDATMPATGARASVHHLYGEPGAFVFWLEGRAIATGIGTREDALNAARRLGAVVRGE